MTEKKTTFALFFGNRGFFPSSLIAAARDQMVRRLKDLGHDSILMDADATRFGAVESPEEGRIFAQWLRDHEGEYDGVILSLPNFGSENGAIAAFRDCTVPILVHGYPDDLDKMAPELRRDAFCGKFSVMDVFVQNDLKFTALKPHVVSPDSPRFAENIDYFDRMCRVVAGMKNMVVGAIGARTTYFKTVRIDEVALQRKGITMETLDLSEIFYRMTKLNDGEEKMKAKIERLRNYTNWDQVPDDAFLKLARLGVAIDDVVEEYHMDAIAVRCWIEMEQQLGIAPCVLLGEMNERGLTASCEVDMGNALAMYALSKASGKPATVLDWNNNYGEQDDQCILFHCGPVPTSMMTTCGCVTDHSILMNDVGPGNAYGPCQGRISPTPMSYGSMLTQDGQMKWFFGEGKITDDEIPEDFFGCAGVAEIDNLQDILQSIGYAGHRHHVSMTPGHIIAPVVEALEKYVGCEVIKY